MGRIGFASLVMSPPECTTPDQITDHCAASVTFGARVVGGKANGELDDKDLLLARLTYRSAPFALQLTARVGIVLRSRNPKSLESLSHLGGDP